VLKNEGLTFELKTSKILTVSFCGRWVKKKLIEIKKQIF